MGARCGYQRQERVAPSSHIQRKTSSEHEEENGLVERLEYSVFSYILRSKRICSKNQDLWDSGTPLIHL